MSETTTMYKVSKPYSYGGLARLTRVNVVKRTAKMVTIKYLSGTRTEHIQSQSNEFFESKEEAVALVERYANVSLVYGTKLTTEATEQLEKIKQFKENNYETVS